MSRYLVTGASGFIGSRLRQRLESLGHEVETYDLNQDLGETPSLLNFSGLHFDAVFHVGANSSTLASDVQSVMTLNYEFTDLLSSWCLVQGIPMIYSSSAACYGEHGARPSNLYAWSKYAGERAVLRDGGVALRYFNVYGPGECHKGNMSSFMHQARVLQGRQQVVRLFPGSPKRDFIYVDDVCEANLLALNNYETVKGECFDVGTGSAHTFEECLQLLGIDWQYDSERSIPSGYQFFTRADARKFLPDWNPGNFSERVNQYRLFLEGNCNHEISV